MENNSNEGSKKIYVAVIVLLLLLNAVTVYLLLSENKAKNDLGAQKAKLDLSVKSLNDTLDAKRMELEQFRGKNAELDSIINTKEAEIDKQIKGGLGIMLDDVVAAVPSAVILQSLAWSIQ